MNGREKRTPRPGKRAQLAAAAAAAAAQEESMLAMPASRADTWKKGKQKQQHHREFDEGVGSSSTPHIDSLETFMRNTTPQKRGCNGTAADNIFMQWEELLRGREELKQRLNVIATVHGWESQALRNKSFLGGVETKTLVDSLRAEVQALLPAADDLGKAGLLLELRESRREVEHLSGERDRLAEDLRQLQEEVFEQANLLAGQTEELDTLRQDAHERSLSKGLGGSGDGTAGGGERGATSAGSSSSHDASWTRASSLSDSLSTFKIKLSRDQMSEGRRVVEALEHLKLPDEASMPPRELACWFENKKTIVNSLKTLSSQIYSARARIIYEIIQNADDCAFDEELGEPRELMVECGDDALVTFHNERGFQPSDLYAMCQVGESSKHAGSGKIGRKGIGFKSVFQISDRPVVISPPFQFCFDVVSHGIFGYIVPTWLEDPKAHVPRRHHDVLRGLSSSTGSGRGTLLVCPFAPRVRASDLLRDFSFDGLALAFLKNLEKITFISPSMSNTSVGADTTAVAATSLEELGSVSANGRTYASATTQSCSIERSLVLEEHESALSGGASGAMLRGIGVLLHQLFDCTIVEQRCSAAGSGITETRRYYRLHKYTTHLYKQSGATGASGTPAAASVASTAGNATATTTIALAFPVNEDLSPRRSEDGELIFAYLPVTGAGLNFAIHADFELVASRQDVSDNHSGNHVLLGRIPRLFVHAVLTDPMLGEDSFATYLPDVDAARKDRIAGGRSKWYSLATALHRETGAYMMIRTEDGTEKVPRRNVVLRPKHLSKALVPNALLKQVSNDELHFAHPEAVAEMCLETCLEVCPVRTVLDCIQLLLSIISSASEARTKADHAGTDTSFARDQDESEDELSWAPKGRRKMKRRPVKYRGDGGAAPSAGGGDNGTVPHLSEEMMLDVWCYIAAEYATSVQKGGQHDLTLRLLADALIGGLESSHRSSRIQPFRIFPVRGSSTLRMHSEHGVLLCIGLAPSLHAQGASVARLAEKVIPQVDLKRLAQVDGISELLHFLRVREATQIELDQQLTNCFRFGLATTADPQLWWDCHRYCRSRGYEHGLADFMPAGLALALPVEGARVVSSRDVTRLTVALPCLLGLRRKLHDGKTLLALPPSVASAGWAAQVRWELAMVRAFGTTFPKADAERIPSGAFGSDLLFAVADAREKRDIGGLEALLELLSTYQQRMPSLLPKLQAVMATSHRPEECLLERRHHFHSFPSSCSPHYIAELLEFANITIAESSFHETRSFLESTLGMLQLRQSAGNDSHRSEADEEHRMDEDIQLDADAATYEPVQQHDPEGVGVSEEDDTADFVVGDDLACSAAVWDILERLLGFHHAFVPSDCPRLLYSVLTPALLSEDADGNNVVPHADRIVPCIASLAWGALHACLGDSGLRFDRAVWPLICSAGGIWIGADFITLKRCVWNSSSKEVWAVLQQVGCTETGLPVVAMESSLLKHFEAVPELASASLIDSIRHCCLKGVSDRHSGGGVSPALPYPSDLDMMVRKTIPSLLQSEGVTSYGPTIHAARRALHPKGKTAVPSEPTDSSPMQIGINTVTQHVWSAELISCYAAICGAALDEVPRGMRLEIPVPSVTMQQLTIIVDRQFNKLQPRDSAMLVVLPEPARFPLTTDFALQHASAHCLHPTMTHLFASIAERQSVGLESPHASFLRAFSRNLRLAMPSVDSVTHDQDRRGADGCSVDAMWALLAEAFERPLDVSPHATLSPSLPLAAGSAADRWDLVLWAAISCATQWLEVQETGSPEATSRYQETIRLARRLVPVVEAVAETGAEHWMLLDARHHDGAAAMEVDPSTGSAPILVLQTLFGSDLWGGGLVGIELRGGSPTATLPIPSRILSKCKLSDDVASSNSSASLPTVRRLPEDFERASLVLIWEWFLLEVAGAAPPAVLWATIQEPISTSSRPRIRTAITKLKQAYSPIDNVSGGYSSGLSLESALLEAVLVSTQAERLLDEMDAADEARRLAASREAEERRLEAAARRVAAEAQRRELAARRQQERAERERLGRERAEREQFERERDRHARMEADSTTSTAARAARPNQGAGSQAYPLRPVRHLSSLGQGQNALASMEGSSDAELEAAVDAAADAAVDGVSIEQALGALGVSNVMRRLLGETIGGSTFGQQGGAAGGGIGARRRQATTAMMRESEVKGKLVRFLAGMRALERQQQTTAVMASQQPLPTILAEFVNWAGDFLSGETGREAASQSKSNTSTEAAARRYLVGGIASSSQPQPTDGDVGARSDRLASDESDTCSICMEVLNSPTACDELGEPLETACSHRFHAVCYARLLEASNSGQTPVCPLCRSDDLSVRFVGR